MPLTRSGIALGSNNTLYLFGGSDGSGQLTIPYLFWADLDSKKMHRSVTSPPLNFRQDATMTAIGDKIYIWGGRNGAFPDGLFDGAIYDLPSGTFEVWH